MTSGLLVLDAGALNEGLQNVIFPVDTAIFAALLALIYVGLTAWVMLSRTSKGTLQGDRGDESLQKRVRAHGNFGEYVPLSLVVIGLYEGGGGSHGLTLALLWLLLIGRCLHPFGLFAQPNSVPMFACRGGGMLATLLALAIGAIALLLGHL